MTSKSTTYVKNFLTHNQQAAGSIPAGPTIKKASKQAKNTEKADSGLKNPFLPFVFSPFLSYISEAIPHKTMRILTHRRTI